MSKPFTYEIDERRLRLQMSNMEMPLKEEAWAKFEAYAQAHPPEQPIRRFKNFELNLNRNVLLPVVFGIIISVFSFLLFNFISLKKPLEQETQKLPESAAVAEQNKQITEPAAPNALESVALSEKTLSSGASVETIVQGNNTAPDGPSPSDIQNEVSEKQTRPQNSVILPVKEESKTEPVTHRKSKRNSEQQLSEIKPSTVSDEEEVEVVPN